MEELRGSSPLPRFSEDRCSRQNEAYLSPTTAGSSRRSPTPNDARQVAYEINQHRNTIERIAQVFAVY